MNQRRAFTLIELLTVIAIIAILAAIIVPAIMRTKDSAYRNSDMSNMNSIRTALQQYKTDQGGYPPALLGYVTLYTSGPNMGQVIPANLLSGYLYSKRVPSIDALRPAFNRVGMDVTTNAVWPGRNAPAFSGCSSEGNQQAYDYDNPGWVADVKLTAGNPAPVGNPANALNFYKVSGYDVADAYGPSGAKSPELRYSLFWTTYGLGANGCGLGSGNDSPRQLGYDDPPETTVVTWNSFFREGTTVPPANTKRDAVLFLGGSARMMDSRNVYEQAWNILP